MISVTQLRKAHSLVSGSSGVGEMSVGGEGEGELRQLPGFGGTNPACVSAPPPLWAHIPVSDDYPESPPSANEGASVKKVHIVLTIISNRFNYGLESNEGER